MHIHLNKKIIFIKKKMKQKLKINLTQNFNLNQKLLLSYREPSLNLSVSRNISSIENKQQILFNHKSSLEILLNTVKNFQLEYFLIKKKNKNKTTKTILISLKENLNLMLEEKNKKYNYIKNKNETSKKKIQNMLSIHSNFIFEKNQLESLNFQIENEIEKTKFLIQLKRQEYSYVKSIPFFFEANREIFCNNNFENNTKISELLKEIIRGVRKDFIETVKEKMKKELEINSILLQINYIKDNIENYESIGCKKYIDSEEIIQEESKEYSKSIITNQSKRNSLASKNNNKIIKMSSINSRGTKKYKIKKKERTIKDNLQNNNIFFTNKLNREIFSDINNKQVNNYLNMNINVNINLNNNNNNNNKYIQESFNSSLDSKDSKNEQYEMDLDNNKIIVTPIITNEHKNNSINVSNSNDDSFILDINEK